MAEAAGINSRARRRGRPPGSRSQTPITRRRKTEPTALTGRSRRRQSTRRRSSILQQQQQQQQSSSDDNMSVHDEATEKVALPASSPIVPQSKTVDPYIFAQLAHKPTVKEQQQLTQYLQSWVTLLDDTVVSSLPKQKERMRGAPGSMIKRPDPMPAETVENQETRYAKMQQQIEHWVDSTASTMHRISQLRRQGMLRDNCEPMPSPRLLPPALPEPPKTAAREPRRKHTAWDQLLTDIVDRYREITTVSRRRRIAIRKYARATERLALERMRQRGEFVGSSKQLERMEREQKRKLAKWTANQVMRKWNYVEQIVEEQRQMEREEDQAQEDKRVLFDMLQRSTKLLEEQRLTSPNSIDESESDMNSSDESTTAAAQDDRFILSSKDQEEGTAQLLMASDTEKQGSDSDSDVVLAESGDESSEFASESETDDEMSELARDQDVPMTDLISEYQRMQMEVAVESEYAVPVPTLLRGKLREYQRQGLDWLASLYKHNTNGILADEMGLGKTVQTLALLAHLADQGVWGPHLIIVPTSVLLNWEQELLRWVPGLKVLAYFGGRAERRQKRRGWSRPNAFHVCITSYQLAIQDARIFRRKNWCYMVLDEAQAIKNFRSQRWQTLLGFKTQHRLLLTGTPLQNSLMELWSLLHFLMPHEEGFAGMDRFRAWFSQPLEKLLATQPSVVSPVAGNAAAFVRGSGLASGADRELAATESEARQAVQKLHAVLRPHVLRRLKRDVETQLPRKIEHVIYCDLSRRQRELYDDFMQRSQTRDTLQRGAYIGVMGCLMQLRKVCNHPDLFETRPIRTSWAVSGSPIATIGANIERLLRRRLVCDQPWQQPKVWEQRGLIPHVCSALARQSTLRLDASALLLQYALRVAQSALDQDTRQIVASRERSWEELDMQPYETRYLRIEESMQAQQAEDARHCADNWLRLAELNRQRANAVQHASVCFPHIQLYQEPRCKLILSAADWIEQGRDVTNNFVFVTPAVVVTNLLVHKEAIFPHLRSSELICDVHPNILHVRRRVQHKTGLLRDAEIRQQIAFPEPFLLQYDCGKLQALDRLLHTLVSGGHRVLLFTQMTRVLDILEQWLNLHGMRYLRLDGATRVEQRWRLTEMFNHDTRWSVFISSTRAGGLGINLTGADSVIFYDSDWNHAMDAQCQDRCHRIGQLREVHVYRLISKNSVEEAIWRKQCEKRWLDNVVIQQGRFDPAKQHEVPDSSEDMAQAVSLSMGDWYDLAASVLKQANSGAIKPAYLEQLSDQDTCKALAAAEDDAHDTQALQMAISEVARADALDLGTELPSATAAIEEDNNALEEAEEADDGVGHIDDYMLRFITMEEQA
ncbi:swr1 complex component [Coemansia sp. RSA 989]|nr:swr1 complex component [Coemansia sp. RSA 1086]KAJ1752788.1 swr1 complex component [Coemansia sp. RSA 1821]KAJ1865787.1 swr1 complex component [Coemansia sp. RSA 989]KAJ1875201.1 swr1 complex component [Coemansia sp. RSA 990]KAJ2671879.1 swr1 complex component [Coemansia sp. RSA 1085]